MNVSNSEYDVLIIGSSFAGTLLATILSKHEMRVLVVDRQQHPRFAIGESSTPVADLILNELAQKYDIESLQPLVRFGTWQQQRPEIRCGCKRGFSYFWHGRGDAFHGNPDHDHELLVASSSSRESADTHWYRSDVDAYFAAVARDHNARLLERTAIETVERNGRGDWQLSLRSVDQHSRAESVQARFLVDATGSDGFLLKHFGIADLTSTLRTHTSAMFGHFDQVSPLADWLESCAARVDHHPYLAIDSAVHHLFHDGWMWQLQFEDGPTSLGYVFDQNNVTSRSRRIDWDTLMDQRPVLRSVLGRPQLSKFPGRIFSSSRIQRLHAAAAGNGWAALPSTVGLIDPLHSTGIAHSLSGVQRLADILLSEDASRLGDRLQEYSDDVVEEFRMIDRLVWGCYAGLRDFRLFSAWSMIYFAVATNSERLRATSAGGDHGFLGAKDPEVKQVIGRLTDAMQVFVTDPSNGLNGSGGMRSGGMNRPGGTNKSDGAIEVLCDHIRRTIEPINHVGLFRPDVPNMYHQTAAE